MARHPKTVTLDGFSGLNNVTRPERTDPKFLKRVENVDVDKGGGLHLRKGYTLLGAGNYHSLWSSGNVCFAIRDGYLVQIQDDYSVTAIRGGIGSNPVSFTKIEDRVYFASTTVTGILEL